MLRTMLIPFVAIGAIGLACIAGAKPDTATQVLLEARTYKYQFRAGQFERAHDSLALLESAARSASDNVEILNELGTAYFMQLTAAANAKADPKLAGTAAQSALKTFDRVLEIDPSNAYATAGRGMARSVLANQSQSIEMYRDGVADLNRAVELTPSNVPVRLMRAFSSLALPPTLRHDVPTEEDLGFLMTVADGTRAGDIVTILLADLHWENGRRDESQRTYERVAQRASAAGEIARARLDALRSNQSLPVADVATLHRNIGRNCTLCHGH